MHRYWFAFLLTVILTAPAWGQSSSLVVASGINGDPGNLIDVPVLLSSTERISGLRLTLEFDSAVMSFVDARSGSDATGAGLTSVTINASPPFPVVNSGVDSNFLVQVRGNGSQNWLSGTNKEIAVLTFRLSTSSCNTSALLFNLECSKTQLATTSLQTLCAPGAVQAIGGDVSNCTTAVESIEWTSVKRLYQ